MLGLVQLARTTDKAKALAHGQIGEYKYDCPMDQGLFEYLGMDGTEFLNIVKTAKNDGEIEAYVKPFLAKKDAQSIEAFNKNWLWSVPTGDSLKHFQEQLGKIAPTRTDVTTWSDLLDLEEGREVPRRQPMVAQRETVRV
jgi:hypothetical protein